MAATISRAELNNTKVRKVIKIESFMIRLFSRIFRPFSEYLDGPQFIHRHATMEPISE